MSKYGLSDFWYKDMMLTRKKLIENGKKDELVSEALAAARIQEYISERKAKGQYVHE